MSTITLSKAVRSNLLNLQSTADLLGKSQTRLASGLRVNSALDNPTNFFTAQNLNSRAGDLNQLMDSIATATKTVQAAGDGITAISKLVETAQATVRTALQTAATVSETTTVTPVTEHFARVVGATFTTPAADGPLTINGVDVQLDTLDDIPFALSHIAAANIPGITAAAGSGADAGKIVLTAAQGVDITIGSTIAGFSSGDSDTYVAPVTGGPTTTTSANPRRAELVSSYNDVLAQITAVAKDSGFNGVNLLNGDNLSVLFNEDGSSHLEIDGATDTAASLGLTNQASSAFDTNSGINVILRDLTGAIDTLRTQSAKLGSSLSVVETRQSFTSSMIAVLQTGASNLTLADSNDEAANVLALQTRQQLSSTALSLASQADQNVLRLF
ncbi:MAG: flagellin [Devosia sp.]